MLTDEERRQVANTTLSMLSMEMTLEPKDIDAVVTLLERHRAILQPKAQNEKIISSVRVATLGGHVHLDVFVRGGKAGTLVVDVDDGQRIIDRLRDSDTAIDLTTCPTCSGPWPCPNPLHCATFTKAHIEAWDRLPPGDET